MSSKTDPDPRPWSLALRLTVWYAGSAFALVLVATGYLYLAIARQIADEDDGWLAGKVSEVLRVAQTRPDDQATLRRQVEAGGGRAAERILVRVDDARWVAPVSIETPGLSEAVPLDAFPDGAVGVCDFRSADGRLFRLRTERGAGGAIVVRAALDRTEDEVLLEGHRRRLAFVLGLSLVACTVGGYRLARQGIRPIEGITATAGRIDPARLGERIETHGLPAEVRDLAQTFNRMLARLEDAFGRLSRFSADIAHELRTPVNNLRGEIEVALQRDRPAEEYREVIGSALEEAVRLGRLIDSLLFLARAEHPKTQISREPVDVCRELREICEYYEATAAEAGVRLAVAGDDRVSALLDRPLLRRAVGNLVANALAHTPPGGVVTLSARQDPDATEVAVADTGGGVAAEHLPYLFDRFYRVDTARVSNGGRVGLGLAIVKGIAELHSGSVSIASELGRGTRVRLRFPHVPADDRPRPTSIGVAG